MASAETLDCSIRVITRIAPILVSVLVLEPIPALIFLMVSESVKYVTVYGKTFEGENFCGFRSFLANRESFPLESFAVYST